jgi:hypothetical protein
MVTRRRVLFGTLEIEADGASRGYRSGDATLSGLPEAFCVQHRWIIRAALRHSIRLHATIDC